MAQETVTARDILRQSLDRNRYFYGKLMTVKDFHQEQLYFNSKRWLINRLLFGSGVVYGLQVSAGTEPNTVVIQPGLALDPLGREVTVPEVAGGNKVDLASLIVKASSEKFTGDNEKRGHLCLSHRECPKEPVPALRSSACSESCESSRWSEGFEVTWDDETSSTHGHSLCERWLNTQTISITSGDLRIERTTPLWVNPNDVFEVVVRVTALNRNLKGVTISEKTNASVIEPAPSLPSGRQFPTPAVRLRAGEFFVYVYQVKALATDGLITLDLDKITSTPDVDKFSTEVEPLSETMTMAKPDDEKSPSTVAETEGGEAGLTSTITVGRHEENDDTQFLLESDSGEPKSACVPIARIQAQFNDSTLKSFTVQNLAAPRFRYSLQRVTRIVDCLRASLAAQAGSPRPGHALVTFNDLETKDPMPIGAKPSEGSAFTAARGDHMHALLHDEDSGLVCEDQTSKWRIDGKVGGKDIQFLETVRGQRPKQADHLVTKGYVDSRIAGLDWQESVLSKKLTAPPEKPKAGDRYLLFDTPTSPWVGAKKQGAKNDIAHFNGKNWVFTTPDKGTATFVEDEKLAYLFVEKDWIPFLATPDVAAGDGLVAHNAVFSVNPGNGIIVESDKVQVDFGKSLPQPIGLIAAHGATQTAADAGHVHTLPLAEKGPGLIFDRTIVIGPPTPIDPAAALDRTTGFERTTGLRVDGPVAGEKINFLNPVSGQDPREDQHLATKKYVDDNSEKIQAGNGLVREIDVISVRSGPGIKVGDDDVAVVFATDLPRPLGTAPSAGTPKTVAAGDHVHELRLKKGDSGLEFNDDGLRINGLVGGKTNFALPVSGVDGSAPEHLATKGYVDSRVVSPPPVIAGKGLVSSDHAISVGEGDGIMVGEDSIAVQFGDRGQIPAPDTERGDSGSEVVAARRDHSHPLPLVTPGATSGVTTFAPPSPNKRFTASSDSINPELGEGAISVQLAFMDPRAGDTYYCAASNFAFMAPIAGVPGLQLAAKVKMGAPTTFQILVDMMPGENQPLPTFFQVMWFAYLPRFLGGPKEIAVGPPTR